MLNINGCNGTIEDTKGLNVISVQLWPEVTIINNKA